MGKINLHDAIKATYGSKEHENNIIKKGYVKDNELSSHNPVSYTHLTLPTIYSV